MKYVAVVTGASSGIGKEFAHYIAENFKSISEIWIVARRKDRLEREKAYIETFGKACKVYNYDVCDDSLIGNLVYDLDHEDGHIKLLVNAAGFGKIGLFAKEASTLEEITGMVDVNVRALTRLTKVLLPYMAYNSRIINMASAAAFMPQPNFAVYAATKAYVLSLSRALNEEIKHENVYVTAVCPGPVKTEFFDIAESHGTVVKFKKYFMADPKKVVDQAIKDSILQRTVSVYGTSMNLLFLFAKLIPHAIILKITSIFTKVQDDKEE